MNFPEDIDGDEKNTFGILIAKAKEQEIIFILCKY